MKKPARGSPKGRRPPRRSAGSSRKRPDPAASGSPADLVVGRIWRPHGLRGEASVELLTDFPERFLPGRTLAARSLAGALVSLRISSVRPHGKRLLVLFEGVDTPEALKELRGADLCALPGDEPARPEGYLYRHEAVGLAAVARDGRSLGTVRELIDVAGRPLLLLETPRGPREVPFSGPIVVSVDLSARRIVLDPPEGLLD